MYAETKRRTFLQIGVFTGAMGVLLALVGLYYVNSVGYPYGDYFLQRAAALWGGILLVAFSVRNVTLAFPATRFREEGMWDMCSAVWTNLISLLISGAVVGITLWAHIDFFQNAVVDTLDQSKELVNLVSILLIGVLAMLASLVGSIIACFPVSDADEAAAAGEQYGMENHGFNKH